jgi:hypothetical protein
MDLDALNLDTHTDYHAAFSCADMAGATCALPPGSYSLAMRLRDATGTVLSELLAPSPVAVVAGQTRDLGVIPFDSAQGAPATSGAGGSGGTGGTGGAGQGIALSWTIDRAGTTLTCDQAGATTVEVDDGQHEFEFKCSDGQDRTTSMTPGSYQVTLRLLDAQGSVLSGTTTMTVTIAAGQLVDLGAVVFDVN